LTRINFLHLRGINFFGYLYGMDIFESVEREIGPYSTWPSYILKYLFCEVLNNTNRMVLSAFFYGNGVSLFRTIELIRYCVPYFGDFSDGFSIENRFKVWAKYYTARSKKRYYNLLLDEVRDLNGSKRKVHLERRVPVVLQKDFDGLNEECIETIRAVFRRWLNLEILKSSFFDPKNPEIPIALRTNDETIFQTDCTQESLVNVLIQGVHDVPNYDPDLHLLLNGVFDVPYNQLK